MIHTYHDLYESRAIHESWAMDTFMAGLACGEPSLLAWQEQEQAATAFVAIPDYAAEQAIRLLAMHGWTIGESGVAGLAALMLVTADTMACRLIGLSRESRILLFATEGATDVEVYESIVCSHQS